MPKKPTYKELEYTVEKLKQEDRNFEETRNLLGQIENQLKATEQNLEKALERSNKMIFEAEIAYLELNQIFNNTSDGICLVDVNQKILRMNQALATYLDLEADKAAHMQCNEVLCTQFCQSPDCLLDLIKSGKTVVEQDIEIKIKNGAAIPFILTAKPFKGLDAELIGIIVSFKDIAERKQYETQLQLMASVFENTVEAITIADDQGIIEKVNPAFTTITGYQPDEIIGKYQYSLRSDHHEAAFYRQIQQSLIQTGHWSGEIWNRRKNGEAFIKWLSVTAIKGYNGQASHYVSVFRDITDNKRTEEEIKYQAYHDALTGLPNRHLFNDRLKMAMAHAKRNKLMAAVMFLDLDNFKQINDRLGHNIGDLLLKEVAQCLQTCCRKTDTVSRLAGDEFTLVLPDVKNDKKDAEAVARRIIASFSQPFIIGGHEIIASSSIGIAFYPIDGEDVETLMKNADAAMYSVKNKGKNDFKIFQKNKLNN